LTSGACIVGFGAAAVSQRSFVSAGSSDFWKSAQTIYEFTVKDIRGNDVNLKEKYEGKVVLIANVASQWGLTRLNYQQLQALYSKYADSGFRVMAFPCNQFANQEPGSSDEIEKFATQNFGATFDLYDKIKVNGQDADPLWKFLQRQQPGALGVSLIKWNFTKFLVDREGVPMKRFGPKDHPLTFESDIAIALKS